MAKGIKIITDNKKARHSYSVESNQEAGIVLTGSEVKSLRNNGTCQLKDAYVSIIRGELFLQKAYIAPYTASSYNNHEPEQKRKLLMHKFEIERLEKMLKTTSQVLIPMKMYFKKGKVKVDVGICKGKKLHDKRQDLKKKAADREMERGFKKSR